MTATEGETAEERQTRVIDSFREIALAVASDEGSLPEILRLVGRRLTELLGLGRCSVFLRRTDGRFQGQVGWSSDRGDFDGAVRRMVAGGRRDPFTQEIVRRRVPVAVQNAATDPRYSEEVRRQFRVRDVVGVPLVIEDDVIGVIFVDDERNVHEFTEQELATAEVFAGLAALAVRQSWLFQTLNDRTRALEREQRTLEASNRMSNQLATAILDGRPVPEIITMVAQTLALPTILYHADLSPSAQADPQPGRTGVRGVPLTQGELRHNLLRTALAQLGSGEVAHVMVPATPELRNRRLLVRLVAGESTLGYLELQEQGRPFARGDIQMLEQASLTLSVILLSELNREQEQDRARRSFLANLVHQSSDVRQLIDRAPSLGVDPTAVHLLLRLDLAEGRNSGGEHESEHDHAVVNRLDTALGEVGRCVVATRLPGADLILVEAAGAPDETVLVERLGSAFEDLRRWTGMRYLAVSSPCRRLEDVAAAAEELREVIALCAEAGAPSRVVMARDFQVIRMLNNRQGLRGALAQSEALLRPLMDYNGSAGSDLIVTLTAFIDAGAQIRKAAEMLDVHENTIRYRLSRIRDLTGIDPNKLDSVMAAAVALQVRRLMGA